MQDITWVCVKVIFSKGGDLPGTSLPNWGDRGSPYEHTHPPSHNLLGLHSDGGEVGREISATHRSAARSVLDTCGGGKSKTESTEIQGIQRILLCKLQIYNSFYPVL